MLVGRLVGMLLLITLGVMLVMFAITKDRKWLRIFGRTLAVGLAITVIFIGIFFFERFLLAV